MKIIYHIALLLVFYLFGCAVGNAQDDNFELRQDSIALDSTLYDGRVAGKSKKGFFSMFEGNPGRAALYSTVVPGAGQIYNKKYWKAPIVWGLEGAALYSTFFYHTRFDDFDIAYKQLLKSEIVSYRGLTNPTTVKSYRDRYRKFRDYSIVAIFAAHILNIADAFVDRHLIEFDIEDDISFRAGIQSGGIGISIAFH